MAGPAAGGLLGAGLISAQDAAAQAPSDSLLRSVLERGHLIVGAGSTNPPWHVEDEAGELQGLDSEMGKAGRSSVRRPFRRRA